MAVHRELDTLLKTCSQCVRTTQIFHREVTESIRVTKDAVQASRVLIAQSDAAIQRVHMFISSSSYSSEQHEPQLQGELETVSDCTFDNERVLLDGKHFINCTLHNCTLEYSGQPVVLETTAFRDCNFQFRGPAALTIQLLECFEMVASTRKSEYSTDSDTPLRREQLN